jgi:hypothetical protein
MSNPSIPSSVPSASIPSSVPAPSASATSDPLLYSQPASISASFRMELATLLHVPAHLVGSGDVSLQMAYQKYCAYLAACQTLDQMSANKSWIGKKPSKTELIEIFVSKSFFHSHYKRLFPKIVQYPDMVKWLECKGDQLSDVEVWGIEKAAYVYRDLEIWLDHGGTWEIEEKELKKGRKNEKEGNKKEGNKKEGNKKDKGSKKDKKKDKKEKKGSFRKIK